MVCTANRISTGRLSHGHAECKGLRGAYKPLVGKPEGNTRLGRFTHRCEDNIKMDRVILELWNVFMKNQCRALVNMILNHRFQESMDNLGLFSSLGQDAAHTVSMFNLLLPSLQVN